MEEEIDAEEALRLVRSGKSVFVWIGGYARPSLAELLGLKKSEVIEARPFDLLDRNKYPGSLLKYERPIFVCHHGISSYELVMELAGMGIKGYSLRGGIEGIKESNPHG